MPKVTEQVKGRVGSRWHHQAEDNNWSLVKLEHTAPRLGKTTARKGGRAGGRDS